MNKVWLLPAQEDWICDRLCGEFEKGNPDIVTSNPYNANVLWLLSDWRWKDVPRDLFVSKKILVTVHHIVPEKFDLSAQQDFFYRDFNTTAYHVYNVRTLEFIKSLTHKPIHFVPYWCNQNIWTCLNVPVVDLRIKHGIPTNKYLVFSAQRDTEGHDLKTAKMEKGPDIFCDYVENLSKTRDDVHVVLAGWRRQYVIKRLEQAKVPYTYFERPQQHVINELYNCVDLYVVSSRCEGGPQALLEAGLTQTPVISTPVGIAEQVLPPGAINTDLMKAKPAIPDVEQMKLPQGFLPYRKLIESL